MTTFPARAIALSATVSRGLRNNAAAASLESSAKRLEGRRSSRSRLPTGVCDRVSRTSTSMVSSRSVDGSANSNTSSK